MDVEIRDGTGEVMMRQLPDPDGNAAADAAQTERMFRKRAPTPAQVSAGALALSLVAAEYGEKLTDPAEYAEAAIAAALNCRED